MKFPRSRISSISPWIRWPGQTGIGTTFSTVERDNVPAYVTFAVPGSRWKVPFASDALSFITSGSIDRLAGVFRRESEMSGPPGQASVAPTTTAPPFSHEIVDPVTVKGALGAYGCGTSMRAYAQFAASTPTFPWRDAATWSTPVLYPRNCTPPWNVVSRRDASTSVKESSSGRMRNRPRGIVTGPGNRGVSTSRFPMLPAGLEPPLPGFAQRPLAGQCRDLCHPPHGSNRLHRFPDPVERGDPGVHLPQRDACSAAADGDRRGFPEIQPAGQPGDGGPAHASPEILHCEGSAVVGNVSPVNRDGEGDPVVRPGEVHAREGHRGADRRETFPEGQASGRGAAHSVDPVDLPAEPLVPDQAAEKRLHLREVRVHQGVRVERGVAPGDPHPERPLANAGVPNPGRQPPAGDHSIGEGRLPADVRQRETDPRERDLAAAQRRPGLKLPEPFRFDRAAEGSDRLAEPGDGARCQPVDEIADPEPRRLHAGLPAKPLRAQARLDRKTFPIPGCATGGERHPFRWEADPGVQSAQGHDRFLPIREFEAPVPHRDDRRGRPSPQRGEEGRDAPFELLHGERFFGFSPLGDPYAEIRVFQQEAPLRTLPRSRGISSSSVWTVLTVPAARPGTSRTTPRITTRGRGKRVTSVRA